MISETSTLSDVAFEVCTALDAVGFVSVLTGGSAATFHAPDAYQSDDLDFVLTLQGKGGEQALESIGFRRRGNFYVHDRTHLTLDFPPGPLAIGEDLVTRWNTARRKGKPPGLVHVLTPTDSCRDRLASFLFWNDFSGLEQALAVARAKPGEVDLGLVSDWCLREGHPEKFELFATRLKAR